VKIKTVNPKPGEKQNHAMHLDEKGKEKREE